MIKAVIFDFGNVIYNFDNKIFLENISKFTEKGVDELNELIYHSSDLLERYETGLISTDEVVNEIFKKCGLSMSKSEFIKAYIGIFTPITTTLDLIRTLKAKYKIGLLSNTGELPFEYVIKPVEVFELFDTVALSYKVRAMKPAKEIYLDALRKLKLKPEECVYIDDIEDFSEAANKLGIHGIHYTSYEKLANELRRLNIEF